MSDRREFLRTLVYSGLGGYLAFVSGACARRSPLAAARFFSADARRTLDAACERLLPADQDPGALELGVPDFIDRALAGDPYYAALRGPLAAALATLDGDARAQHGRAFAALDAIDQDALMLRFQDRDPQNFSALLHLAVEGAFADPIHGGNRDGAGWKLIGFAADPLRTGRV